MARKRKKSFPLKTPEQLRLVSSPAALEIVRALRHQGPASVSELGPMIGRKSNSLHYHIRKLTRSGMVRVTGTRRSGARTESVYDVSADRFEGVGLHKSKKLKGLANEGVRSLTRLAAREFERASARDGEIVVTGRHRSILAHRVSARLTKKQLAEVNQCVDRIEEIFAANVGSGSGEMHAMTIVMSPLDTP
ncbi:MAG: helix-turn-helix domain-containing protein [Acidobacteriota bacterium]|nr:helix-turn-helix domain-containing protein [Acidobacteriota bacterium]MDH3530843.1 helix-turn-helix domain-containing protein [Acidobacteriota bacterium]